MIVIILNISTDIQKEMIPLFFSLKVHMKYFTDKAYMKLCKSQRMCSVQFINLHTVQ